VATEADWRRTSASTESCRVTTCRVTTCRVTKFGLITFGTSFPERMLILLTEENGQGAFSAAVSFFRLTVAAF
jgi:hypothetical protein